MIVTRTKRISVGGNPNKTKGVINMIPRYYMLQVWFVIKIL